MKKLLRMHALLVLLVLSIMGARADTVTKSVTFTASDDAATLASYGAYTLEQDKISLAFQYAKVTSGYYQIGNYTGATFQATDATITKIEIEYNSGTLDKFDTALSGTSGWGQAGTFTDNSVLECSQTTVRLLNNNGSSGQIRVVKFTVTYEVDESAGGGSSEGGDATFVNSSDGDSDYQYNSFNFTVDPITFECNNGSKYGTGLAVQNDAVFTISAAEGYTITKIEFAVSGASYTYGDDPNTNGWFAHCATASTGTFAENLWTGSASSVTFTTKTDWWYWIELSNAKVYFVADAAPAVQSTVNINYKDPHTGNYSQYSTTKGSIQVDGQGYWYSSSYDPNNGYIGMTNGQTTKFTALDDAKILKIKFTDGTGWNSSTFQGALTPSVGSFTSDDTWEGEATEVTFTHGAGMYFTEAEVTYEGGQVYVTAPTFDPASGSVTKGTAVSITQPAAASIIYTLDGTDPTYEPLNGTVYSEAITINAKTTIKAIAVDANGNTSDVVTGEYKIFVAQPSFSPTDVDVVDGTAVTITQADAAYIVYTTDGTVPTYSPLNGTVYTEPVVINANTQFRAIAVDAEGNESDAAYKTYNVIKEYSSLGDVLTNAANNELVNLTLPAGTVLIAKYSNYAFIYNNNEERGAMVFNYNSNSKWPSTFGTTLTGTLRSKWIKTYWDFEETTTYPTAGEVTTVTPKVVTGAEAIASDNSNRYAYIQMDGTFDKDAQTFTAKDGTVFNFYPQTIFGIDWTVVESGDYTLRALMASNYGNSGIAANGQYKLGIVEPVEQSFVAIEETTYPTLAELKAAGSIGTLKIEAPYQVQVMYNVGPFGQTYLWDGETGFFMFGDGENALSATDKQIITSGKITTYTDAYSNRSFKSEKDLVVENATEWIAPVEKETISNLSDAAKYMRLHGKVTSTTNTYTGIKSYLLQLDNGNTRSINNKVGFTYDFEAIEGVDGTFDMLLTWENYAYELVPLDANFFVADETFEPATVLFNETFAAFNGTGGRDNTLGGSVAGTKPAASDFDNDCTFDTNVFEGSESAKLGTTSKNGTITTPAIALTGEGTLSFNMAGWADTKTNSVTVTLTGATFYDASTTKTIDAVNGHWMTTYLDVIDGTGNVTIQFSGRRFFLDDIKVVSGLSELAEVNVGTTGYATLYYSDRNLVVPDGVEVTTHAVVDGSLQATNTLKYGDVIPAGTGVVLFDNFTSSALIYQFATYREAAEAPALANANNMLKGSDEAALTVGDNADDVFYMLSKGQGENAGKIGFYYANGCPNGEAFTNGAHKAYLCVPAALASAYGFAFDGTTVDAINEVNVNALTENDEVYTVTGVRVQNVNSLQRGIYVVNGKRVAVK